MGMDMKKIRVLHYGIGHDHSDQFLGCIKHFSEVFELVGVCEPNEEMKKNFAHLPVYNGVRWLSEEEAFTMTDIDAAIVEAYDLDLVRYAQKCADKGWHIHMDKAAGTDLPAFKKLLQTVKEKRLVFQTGYMFRYNPFVKQAKALAQSGGLGEIYHIDAFMNTYFHKEKREWLSKLLGGDMLYLGCHMIDLVYYFWGVPKRIIPFNKATGRDELHLVDNACAVFEYEKGVALVRASAVEVNGFGRRQFVVCGEKATVEINPLEGPPRARVCTLDKMSRPYANYNDCAEEQVATGFQNKDRYEEMMLDFVSYIRGEKQNPFTLDYEYQLQKMILASCGETVDYSAEENI